MRYTVCLPYVYEPYFKECLKTCKFDEDSMLIIDNTKDNIGIMKSHNRGIEKMKKDNSDWLIILSAAVRFGEPGGLDFIEALEDHPDHLAIEAADVFGWHVIAFSRRLIEKVGEWDENFSPYGYDDLDYSWRIQKAFGLNDRSQLWEKVYIDVKDTTMAHSLKLGGVTTKNEKLRAYYVKKWGVLPEDNHDHAYHRPFNNDDNDIGYWPR